MSIPKRANEIFLGLSIVLLTIIFLPLSRADFEPVSYRLKTDSQYISASSQAEDFSFSWMEIVQGTALKRGTSPGQIGESSQASLNEPEYSHRDQLSFYHVQAGDTIGNLAEKFNVSKDTILWANDLREKDLLKEGKELIILPVSGVMHLVHSGDTLSQIAKDYKVDVEGIKAFNQINEDNAILSGDFLIIPHGKKQSIPTRKLVSIGNTSFILPTEGQISQRLHWYNAIDVANKCGTSVYAVASGTVQKVGYTWNGGNYVRILHVNEIKTYYGHLQKIFVRVGQTVVQGQPVGLMGTTGKHSTGCHLHFDVIGAVNPLAKYSMGAVLSY